MNNSEQKGTLLQRDIPFVTVFLIIANVIVFFVTDFTGKTASGTTLMSVGAFNYEAATKGGEFYRFFTHMFLHAGFEHLFSNMVMLFLLGSVTEKEYGKVKFSIIYLLSGVFGAMFSGFVGFQRGYQSVSVGASGAIFGLFGAAIVLTYIAARKRSKNPGSMLIRYGAVFLLMVFGNMSYGIDWMAHLGGAIMGLLLGILFMSFNNDKEEYYG